MFYITLLEKCDIFYNIYTIIPNEFIADLIYSILAKHAKTKVSLFELQLIIKSAIKQASDGVNPKIVSIIKLYDLNIAKCIVDEKDIESVEEYFRVNK